MTIFTPPISHANRNALGTLAAYQSAAPENPSRTLGLFPPNTDSLGGTMTAGGAEFQRTSNVLIDPATGYPVTLIRV